MTYYIVADVHGFFDILKEALDNAGFDKNNPGHIFVSLGDLLDRGKQPRECLQFVNSLERKILIRGNHEDLMEEMIAEGTVILLGCLTLIAAWAYKDIVLHFNEKSK